MISRSPDKNRHWIDKYTDIGQQEVADFFKTHHEHKIEQEQTHEWQKNNLEYDLRSTEWILNKVRSSKEYGYSLYAALCNNEFIKRDMWQVLKDETWSCSWRYAGGILADMIEEGDYMDWYCSGNEGDITEEIKDDLYQLGWIVVETGD